MPHRFVARKIKNFFIYRVLHIDDTPHRIAMGVAIGMFITWTPTVGLQMILVVALSWLLGANKLVGVPFVWISNPFTLVPIYYPNYMVGVAILGGDYEAPDFVKAASAGGSMLNRMKVWWTETYNALVPLWLGSIIVGLALGILSYGLIYYAVIKYRKLRHRHDAEKLKAEG